MVQTSSSLSTADFERLDEGYVRFKEGLPEEAQGSLLLG